MASSANSDRLNPNALPQLSVSQPRSSSSTANTSPVEPNPTNSMKPVIGGANGLAPAGLGAGAPRLGSSSPSHELGGRLYSKRARDIQAQERLAANAWGPPTSGNSTPLRENIPESPTDGFPDFKPLILEPPSSSASASTPRRVRAGTLPSRFSASAPPSATNVPQVLASKTSRPTPTGSPFQSDVPAGAAERGDHLAPPPGISHTSALLSRLRSGSMPQRTGFVGPAGPFGPTVFSTNWSSNRDRATTLTSIGSTNGPSSPAQSSFSKDGIGDNEMRTLDYLGLADTPQPALANLVKPGMAPLMEGQISASLAPFLVDLAGLNRNLNRFRSYSVNAKEKYAEEEEEELAHGMPYSPQHSGSLTPSAASAAAALAATQAQIHQHNLAVQAFANQASASRPRARTAGVLESPPQRSVRNYLATPSRLDNSITAADLGLNDGIESLPEAVEALQLGAMGGVSSLNDTNQDIPTRALWLGHIPASSTVTSLNAIFGVYGKIESARVLTHKNCGFVNFQSLESAIQAKTLLNGKEIFPGAGPVRIGYAKAPEASLSGTPGANDLVPSPSPEPFPGAQGDAGNKASPGSGRNKAGDAGQEQATDNGSTQPPPIMPSLHEVHADILSVARAMGTNEDDIIRIKASVDQALQYDGLESEIPALPEPGQRRVHDAPKLREIRKRIDNGTCSQAEIEEIALGMLPEIAELSSDYLGNTVVQKLFEYCSEAVKQAMLAKIAPHLAEIGVHKNGTWAAQKIIDLAKTAPQMSMIVDSLRPYTVPLFLDQYGNYVLQCVLRFGSPWNNFIFEGMLSRMSDISQGRFGARAMRACLESHHASKAQQRMLAAAIAVYSVQLSMDANSALLLTWFLDTCTFPRRRTVLAPKIVPHLVQLCTHKVAYLTVLKAVNQRNELEARDMVLKALFFPEKLSNGKNGSSNGNQAKANQVLEDILRDSSCGATLIFKVLTTPFFEERMRTEIVQNVRNVLTRLKAQPAQGYKRLMDEVGLSTRSSGSGGSGGGGGNSGGSGRERHPPRDGSSGRRPASQERPRTGSRHRTPNSRTPQPASDGQHKGANAPPSSYGPRVDAITAAARATNADAGAIAGYDQFGLGSIHNPVFAPGQAVAMPVLPAQQLQQLQFQQAAMVGSARMAAPAGAFAPNVTFATPPPLSQAHAAPLAAFNPALNVAAMFPPAGFPAPAFSPIVGPMVAGGLPIPQLNGMQFIPQAMPPVQQTQQQQQQQSPQPVPSQQQQQQQQQQPGQQGGNRRGRPR